MQFSIDSYDSRDRKEVPYHLKLTSPRPDSALSYASDVEETASLNLECEPRIARELRTEVPMLAAGAAAVGDKERKREQQLQPPALPPKALAAAAAEALNLEVIEQQQQQQPPLPPRKESVHQHEGQREERGPSPRPSLPARPSEAIRKAAAATGTSAFLICCLPKEIQKLHKNECGRLGAMGTFHTDFVCFESRTRVLMCASASLQWANASGLHMLLPFADADTKR